MLLVSILSLGEPLGLLTVPPDTLAVKAVISSGDKSDVTVLIVSPDTPGVKVPKLRELVPETCSADSFGRFRA